MTVLSALSFHVREAIRSLRHAKLMAAATITSIALSLAVLGSFLLFLKNAGVFLGRLHDQYKLIVYLKDGADTDSIGQLKRRFEADTAIESVHYVSREDALKQVLDELVKRLEQDRAVGRVSSGQDWVASVLRFVSITRWLGAVLVVVLGLSSLLIVGNTIWLTVYARRDEISIMRLVGATNWFIRTPFLIEGLLTGILGAMLAFLTLVIGYRVLLGQMHGLAPGLTGFVGWPELRRLGGQLIAMGGLLGFMGSLVSLRRLSV
jgi:cell division transport system permease protein